jgi:hypothetical protein
MSRHHPGRSGRARLAPLIALALLWASIGGGVAPVIAIEGPEEPTSIREAILYHLQFATDIDGTPVDEGTIFTEGVPRVLTLVGWDYVQPGTQLRVRLFQDGRLVLDDEKTVYRASGGGYIFNYQPEGGPTAGTYTAQLDYNGVPDEVATFVILPAGSGAGPVTPTPGGTSDLIPYADPADVLIVTRESVLRPGLGARADAVFAAARAIGDLRDLEADGQTRDTPEATIEATRALLAGGNYRYLLILGNDDAVPFAHLENPMGEYEEEDLAGWELPADWVPSDDPYADLDGDQWGVPDLPIARIPSSDDADVLLAQLGENRSPAGGVFALVNQKRRSQAGAVIEIIDDHLAVETNYTPPTNSQGIPATDASVARYTYILLHGIGVLTNEWSGDLIAWSPEDVADLTGPWRVAPGGQIDGMTVPFAGSPGGVVNVGACYGAWTLDTIQAPQKKDADNSLALRYLRSGTRAFIADTHISYSAVIVDQSEPVARTGFETLFWQSMLGGASPIDAFHAAKIGIAEALDRALARGDVEVAELDLKTLRIMIYLGRP